MGNTVSACQLINHSKRNVRVYVTESALELDAFITSTKPATNPDPAGDAAAAAKVPKTSSVPPGPGGKTFRFRPDVSCVRVLASQTKELPWDADRFLSVFVEDEDDENIGSKQIVHNVPLTAPATLLLYDV